MSKFGKYHWIALFVLIFVVFLGAVRATKPRVFVLYSYDKDNIVSKYLKSGFDDALAANRVPVLVRQHYMGLDTGLTEEQANREANESFGIVQHFAPGVLIIAGHSANKLIAPRVSELSAKTWILPLAVETEPESFGYRDTSRMVEIFRKPPIVGVTDFMTEIYGRKVINVSILGADTPGNQLRLKNFSQGLSGNLRVTSQFLSNCFDQWKNHILSLSSKTDVLLILPTVTLQDRCVAASPVLEASQFIPWVEANSRALPVGTDGAFVKNGGAVSFYPSYNEEGLLAMNLALTLINPNRKEAPQRIYTDSYQVALDASRLQVRNISVPSIYVQYGQKSGLNYQDSD